MTPADHAAWISARATIWAAAFTGISAAGVLWGAWIASRAAQTWRGVHEAAAADQCVATAYECLSAVDRVVSMRWALDRVTQPMSREAILFPEEAFNDAWAGWRRFRTAHVVAMRYYADRLPVLAPDRIAEQLKVLEQWCGNFYGRFPGDPEGTEIDQRILANRQSDAIREAVQAQADLVTETLRPAPPPAPLWVRVRNSFAKARAAVGLR